MKVILARVPRSGYSKLVLGESYSWPSSAGALSHLQEALAAQRPPAWRLPADGLLAAGVALVSARGGQGRGTAGDVALASVALLEIGLGAPREIAAVTMRGACRAPYQAGYLALREGPLLEAAVRGLPERPQVLMVHAAGRDHPRRAGLALMLGAALEVPSIGVTGRPFLATGEPPPGESGTVSPLMLAGEVVGYWVRTRAQARPIVAHAGWRTSPETAAELALHSSCGFRQPEPIRRALEIARGTRAGAAERR